MWRNIFNFNWIITIIKEVKKKKQIPKLKVFFYPKLFLLFIFIPVFIFIIIGVCTPCHVDIVGIIGADAPSSSTVVAVYLFFPQKFFTFPFTHTTYTTIIFFFLLASQGFFLTRLSKYWHNKSAEYYFFFFIVYFGKEKKYTIKM